MADVALKNAKLDRRTAKSALTRCKKTLSKQIEIKRPGPEVRDALTKLQNAFDDLVVKHENYSKLIEDDEEFEVQEGWMEKCQETFMEMEIKAKIYLDNLVTKGKGPLKTSFTGNNTNSTEPEPGVSGISSMQLSESEGTLDDPAETIDDVQNANVLENATDNTVQEDDYNVQNASSVVISQAPQNHLNNSTIGETASSGDNESGATCGFKMEKPKMPKFAGDVREYAIFRADFKHAIESRYSKRDSITFLRACLQGKPLDLIRGIGSDYDAAWDYLDSIYGDPRFVSDTVTQDIVKFRSLQHGDDARFCDLVHLVKRCYNTLKEVGVPNDMDNSHMLSIIEQKMCTDDRKVWSRDLERERKPATLQGLLSWMSVEMKSRMRATAPLRSSSTNQRTVHHVRTDGDNDMRPTNYKCWLCKNSTHWPDQCLKFAALSIDDRLKTAKENHVCFSCLKRAGRDHRAANCTRRQQCTKAENGTQCTTRRQQCTKGTFSQTLDINLERP